MSQATSDRVSSADPSKVTVAMSSLEQKTALNIVLVSVLYVPAPAKCLIEMLIGLHDIRC